MKKTILILVIALGVSFSSALAQLMPSFDLGVKAGLNYSSLKSEGGYFNSDKKQGFVAGVWTRVGILGFHVQPEAYYTTKNSNLKAEGTEEDVRFATVDVPVLLGTKFALGGLGGRIQAGPLFSFIVDKENPSDVFDEPVDFKDQSAAIVGGVGLDISKFSVDLRYEHGLGNLNKNSNKQQLSLWTVSLAFNFL